MPNKTIINIAAAILIELLSPPGVLNIGISSNGLSASISSNSTSPDEFLRASVSNLRPSSIWSVSLSSASSSALLGARLSIISGSIVSGSSLII